MSLLLFLYYLFLINHNYLTFINSVCFIEHNTHFRNLISNNNDYYFNNIINNNHNRKQQQRSSWKSKGMKSFVPSLLFSSNSNIIKKKTTATAKAKATKTTTTNIRQYDDIFLPMIQIDYRNDNHYCYHHHEENTTHDNMDGRAYQSTTSLQSLQSQQEQQTQHDGQVGIQQQERQQLHHVIEAQQLENDANKLTFHYDNNNNQNQILNNSTQFIEKEQQHEQVVRNAKSNRRKYNKLMIENKVSNQLLNAHEHLHVLYVDDHICVVNKPSGILSVPGIRRNPSLAQLVYDTIIRPNNNNDNDDNIDSYHNERIDRMIVHRLDMDTSGLMIFALNDYALKQLHDDFRTSTSISSNDNITTSTSNNNNSFHDRRIYKSYQALLVGHYNNNVVYNNHENNIAVDDDNTIPIISSSLYKQQVPSIIEIDIPIERDPIHIPFMRIAAQQQKHNHSNNFDSNNKFVQKYLINQNPKPSFTEMEIIGIEYINIHNNNNKIPVTRVQLIPHTGRTHQLRVHTSAIGYPIIGDNIYGYNGDGNSGGIQSLSLSTTHNNNIPLCLHAQTLSFYHPYTNIPMIFHSSPPF